MIIEENSKDIWSGKQSPKGTTIVIDGDWLAFVGACMTHVNHFVVTSLESGEELFAVTTEKAVQKNLKELSLIAADVEVNVEKRLIDKWEVTAKGVMIGKANKLKRECGATKILIAIGGKTNFRDRLALLYSQYKDRANSYRPPHLSEVRALLKTLFSFEESNDCEADDLISRYQYLGRSDKSYIVVTEDKDAKQTPGYLYNPRKLEIKDCSGFGQLIPIIKVSPSSGRETFKLDGHGRLWFYYQLICGDKVDTYHPFPKVVSDKAFYNIFKDVDSDQVAWTIIVDWYKRHHGSVTSYQDWSGKEYEGTWVDILQTYVNVVHMQRWENDVVDVRKVLKQYNLLGE